MHALSRLPSELVAIIVEFSDIADLPTLALTSVFRHFAEERLYRTIILTGQIERTERALLSIVTMDGRHKYVRAFIIDLTWCRDSSQSHPGLFQLIECALECATHLTFVWLIHMPPTPLIPSPAPSHLRTIRAPGSLLKCVVPGRPVGFVVFEYSMSYNDDQGGNEYLDVMRKLDSSTGPLQALSILFEASHHNNTHFNAPGPFSAFLLHTDFIMPCVTALDLFMTYYWTRPHVRLTCLIETAIRVYPFLLLPF
jgi:hypothetical protein